MQHMPGEACAFDASRKLRNTGKCPQTAEFFQVIHFLVNVVSRLHEIFEEFLCFVAAIILPYLSIWTARR